MQSTASRLLILARPRGAALITCLPLVGFGYALWEVGSTVHPKVVAGSLALLASVWVFGHAGSMWLNAALDQDEGPVLLGRPVRVPPAAGRAGYLALAGSVALALPLGTVPLVATLICAVLAALYSHPRLALKGSPVGGPLVNGLGYGTLSPVAGWAAAGGVPTWRALVSLVFGVTFIFGAYFAAQAFQGEDDRRRGYRTLVVTHGAAWTLAVAHACLRLSVLGLLVMAALGAYPRALLVGAPLWLWADRHLSAWRRTPSANRSGPLVSRLAWAAALTVAAAYADHFWLLAHDLSPGGCGTRIVPDALRTICG